MTRRNALSWLCAAAAFGVLCWGAWVSARHPESTPVWQRPVGLLLAIFAGAGGRYGWRPYLAMTGGWAAGGLAAGGGRWTGLSVVLFLGTLALWGWAMAHRLRNERLMRTGTQGYGTVLAVSKTILSTGRSPVLRVRWRIEPPGAAAPYETERRSVFPAVARPSPGDRYPVWLDPADPARWTFDTGTRLVGNDDAPPRSLRDAPQH